MSAAEEQKRFVLPPGYRIEPVLTEPDIEEPMQIAFDGNGRMFVLEIRAYMQDADASAELAPTGRISVHEDADNDGVYEKHHVFLDKLVFPRFVMPLGKDAILTMESNQDEVWKYTDTNGDSIADKKELFTTSFGRAGNVEHQQSSLFWGLDNWLYSTYNAFRVRWTPNGVLREPTAPNNSQWGITQDSDRPDLVPGRRQRTSRLLSAADSLRADVSGRGRRTSRTPAVPRARIRSAVGHRRRRGLSTGHQCDPAGRVDAPPRDRRRRQRHRARAPHAGRSAGRLSLRRAGRAHRPPRPARSTPKVSPPSVRSTRPSVRSSSSPPIICSVPWTSRPRQTEPSTSSIPTAGSSRKGTGRGRAATSAPKIDQYKLAANIRKGRIWRVSYDGMARDTTQPRLLDETPAQLVARLAHPNGWWRDTAQQVLVLKQDRSVVPALQQMVRTASGSLFGRIHALWTLEGLGALDLGLVRESLKDPNPQMRIQAIRASETLYKAGQRALLDDYRAAAKDPDTDVMIQAMLTLHLFKAPDVADHRQGRADSEQGARRAARSADNLLRAGDHAGRGSGRRQPAARATGGARARCDDLRRALLDLSRPGRPRHCRRGQRRDEGAVVRGIGARAGTSGLRDQGDPARPHGSARRADVFGRDGPDGLEP